MLELHDAIQALEWERMMERRPMKVHKLKIWPEFFRRILLGHKKFEVRKNDRDYKKGDVLHLYEYNPHTRQYSGSVIGVKVEYILYGGQFGIEEGYCVMSLADWYRDNTLDA